MKACLIVATFLVFACAGAEPGARLAYQSSSGVEFEITADGLTAIRANGRQVASGNWSAWNGESWFPKAGTSKVQAKSIQEKSLAIVDAAHARVRHVKDDLVCVYDYVFSGEDLTISARIENNHATEAMAVTGFSGLTFSFDRLPTGMMQNQHISYFQAHGVQLCHPGFWSPIGGSYAADDSIGIGVSPWRTGLMRTLILWDYTSWEANKRDKVPERRLLYFAVSTIPPRGAQTFDLKLRVSPDRAWQHLLEPYREHFQQTFGAVRYLSNFRWIGTDYLNHSQKAVSPANPYGFHGGHRRIDTTEGAQSFCDKHLEALKGGSGQGVIVWGQGGDDPRGGMYRPDFDVLPPEVEANWPAIQKRFKEADVRLGCCTRPRDMAVRENWKSDEIISINAQDDGHRAMIWKRFKNMLDRGCTLFYLDSFGDSFEDVLLMRFLREKLGPDVQTFCEHQCDAIMPFSGGYSECTLQAEDPKDAHYRVWTGVERWEVYRWLAPGAQLAVRLYDQKGKASDGLEPADRFFFRNHLTPLVPAFDLKRTAALKALQSEFIDENGKFSR